MTATNTRPSAATVAPSRSATIVRSIGGVLAVNLLLYVAGRACGASFTYTQRGKATRVDAVAVSLLSVGPLATGLALVAWLSRYWPSLLTGAKAIAPVLAVGSIGLMTMPAGFDTTSGVLLAAMHLALIPAALLPLRAFAPSH